MFSNFVFSLEGPIGVGKSTILSALGRRGCKIYPEPVATWKPALDRFYQCQVAGTEADATEAAISLQSCVVESLDDRHREIESINFERRAVVMERSCLAALSIFVDINENRHPNSTQWQLIRRSLWDSCRMYETDLKRIALHHDSVETVIARTLNREGSDFISDTNYLKDVYIASNAFEEDCDIVVNCTNRPVSDIADEIECQINAIIESSYRMLFLFRI